MCLKNSKDLFIMIFCTQNVVCEIFFSFPIILHSENIVLSFEFRRFTLVRIKQMEKVRT